MSIRISRTQRQQLLDWAEAAAPLECCGLLLGNGGVVERLVLTNNVAANPFCEFEIDPSALFVAVKRQRQGDTAILGYFHSHPNGLAAPSLTDADMADADGRLWLIIANDEITCWRPISGTSGAVSFAAEDIVWG